ncbi:7-carboxy-7-deazaguanine synthase QueE [Celerinatantimonas yamalensis]|uniref:7-carboxy-7-deazaguanine synthase n=1 Tax=Celerinatantimonas yamalensis TaxID=559956 RepID=A0ABW9G2C7_9GAMM
MSNVIYRVNEVFETIQGEGIYTGVPSVFIRLQGCDVGCPWCDTKHTWDVESGDECALDQVDQPSHDQKRWASATAEQLIQLVMQYHAKHVVITGGEPCWYDLNPLTRRLSDHGYQCQVETSGTYPIAIDPRAWVTLSPKIAMRGGREVLTSAMFRANEVKHPVGRQADIDALDALLARCPSSAAIALQPISQQPRATQLCIQTCIERNWRLSAQLHKYIGVL